jgi:hypothetical protein
LSASGAARRSIAGIVSLASATTLASSERAQAASSSNRDSEMRVMLVGLLQGPALLARGGA